MKESLLKEKSYPFALRIVKLYKYLCEEKKEYVLSKQVLRSGTSVGANIREAQDAPSKADFLNKLNVSLKEVRETEYWLALLKDAEYVEENMFISINKDCSEMIALLINVMKKVKNETK